VGVAGEAAPDVETQEDAGQALRGNGSGAAGEWVQARGRRRGVTRRGGERAPNAPAAAAQGRLACCCPSVFPWSQRRVDSPHTDAHSGVELLRRKQPPHH
jgi:hypothetical protein